MTKIIKIIISLCLFIFIFFKLDEFSHYNISEKDILRGNYDESVAFFDSIPVYQKNFSIENHGLELFDQKKNVISNDHTLFKIKKKRSLLKLYPEDIVIGKNPILYFETQEKLDNLFLEVEIAFETNRKEKFYLTQNYNLKKDPTLFLQKFFNFKKKKNKTT